MRITLPFLLVVWLLSFASLPVITAGNSTPSPVLLSEPATFNANEIKWRVLMMSSPVTQVFNEEIEAYIRRYLTYGAADTEAMLGRGTVIFPIFEYYLALHGLPDDLKYLPMLESKLIPYAVSVKGAAGLWQIIPSTAQALGLVVNKHLDERKDPYKSTEAAVKYLKRMHQRFGSWELALAAYNCGPTRLSRALNNSDCVDFWAIRHRLPKETQQYISRYLAASYVGKYYAMHGLEPIRQDKIYHEAMAARIYKPVSLSFISEVTGLQLATIRQMNPAIKKDFVPAVAGGFYLVLPRWAWYDFLDAQQEQAAVRP